ncbi:MAG: hypothetical protein AB7F66_02965 [Bacteriovoracia bacterium]
MAFKTFYTSVTTLLFGVGILLTVPAAHAGVWVQGGFSFLQSTETQGGTSETRIRTLTTLTGGYRFVQGFFVGAQYLFSRDSATPSSAWAIGPKGGFQYGGFEFTAAYLPIARDSYAAGVRTGNGFALNLGYAWEITGPLRLGFYVTYWTVTYAKLNGADLFIRPQVNYISPQLALVFAF